MVLRLEIVGDVSHKGEHGSKREKESERVIGVREEKRRK